MFTHFSRDFGKNVEGVVTPMTRSEARELAFILLFEHSFSNEPMSELICIAQEDAGYEPDKFACRLAEGTIGHIGEIDELISSCSQNWKLTRISRVALSVMRLSVYEILFEDEIPASVSINEAVELAKRYASKEEASFINGVLGAIARSAEKTEETPS